MYFGEVFNISSGRGSTDCEVVSSLVIEGLLFFLDRFKSSSMQFSFAELSDFRAETTNLTGNKNASKIIQKFTVEALNSQIFR